MKNAFMKFWCLVMCLCFLTTVTAGCEPLRKKFTRQKKKPKESAESMPILTPIDYPPVYHSPSEGYAACYSLWKVWDRDLTQAVDEKKTDKKINYLLGQIVVQLNEMKKRLNEEKRNDLEKVINGYDQLKDVMKKPENMRNLFSLKQEIIRLSKDVRHQFSTTAVQNDLIDAAAH